MTVSIIVPVFNAQARLELCLESILSQTHDDLQVILVDDGSTDKSPHICDAAAVSDGRVCVLHQKNAGPPAARNAGLDAVHGQWVMFVDADDTIDEDYVACMLDAARDADADIVASDCMMHEAERTRQFGMIVPGRVYGRREELWRAFLSDELPWSLWAKLYRAELFEGMRFDSGDYIAEDLDMNARLFAREGLCVSTIEAPGYHYHIETGSVDHTFSERHLCQLEIFERVAGLVRELGIACDASVEVFYEERVLNALRKAIDAGALEGEVKHAFERAIELHREEALSSPHASAVLKRRLRASKLGLGVFSVFHKLTLVT